MRPGCYAIPDRLLVQRLRDLVKEWGMRRTVSLLNSSEGTVVFLLCGCPVREATLRRMRRRINLRWRPPVRGGQ